MKKFYLSIFVLGCLAHSKTHAQTVVSQVFSDYGGFWQSQVGANNSVKPDNNHDLIGFTVNGVTYSTGVDDAALDANNITYEKRRFEALPVSATPTSGSGSYIGVGVEYGGTGNVNPVPVTNNLAYYLTDGINGLNLGSGIYNLPAGQESRFEVSAIALDAIGGDPDIVVTQMGSISGGKADEFRFYDKDGNTVGNVISVDLSKINVVGHIDMKFYAPGNPPTYDVSISRNSDRELRLATYDFADFGLNATNVRNVVGFGQTLSGNSDQAFTAYNAASFTVLQAVTGTILDNVDQEGNPTGIGIHGVTITLLDDTQQPIFSTTTDQDGNYSFANLEPGTYSVHLSVPAGYVVVGNSEGETESIIEGVITESGSFTASFAIKEEAAMAVGLSAFNAVQQDKSFLLTWTTSSENNNKGFNIERSADGKSWKSLSFVASKATNGSSSAAITYSYQDNSPLNGQNIYRLKQIDLDGTASYSDIRTVIFANQRNVHIYPNPATDRINIQGVTSGAAVFVYDAAGRAVYQTKASGTTVVISFNKLPKGLYFIKIVNEHGQSSTHKVVK